MPPPMCLVVVFPPSSVPVDIPTWNVDIAKDDEQGCWTVTGRLTIAAPPMGFSSNNVHRTSMNDFVIVDGVDQEFIGTNPPILTVVVPP
jgi:hypothetical protein